VPYCRGHKSTPSQESNTLSQVSCATDISSPDDHEKVPLELGKTLLCLIWLISGFFATTLSLALTHDRVPDSSPLPDLLLDAVQYQEWGLAASEVLLMICVLTALLVVVAHTHRTVLLRRIWLVLGLLYYYRAITMAVTVLPRPDPTYTCRPKAEEGLTAMLVLRRVLTIVSGGGLSMNGRHVYCGDYIFSGHTMTLVLAHLVTCGYSPPSWRPLHWLSLLASSTGVLLLLISRGHYTIDVLLAYYVTTRLWRLYHAVACTTYFREEGEHNPLSGMFWWPAVR